MGGKRGQGGEVKGGETNRVELGELVDGRRRGTGTHDGHSIEETDGHHMIGVAHQETERTIIDDELGHFPLNGDHHRCCVFARNLRPSPNHLVMHPLLPSTNSTNLLPLPLLDSRLTFPGQLNCAKCEGLCVVQCCVTDWPSLEQ